MTATTVPRYAAWRVLADWNNDGDFGDTAEDVTDDVLAEPGLTVELGLDGARSLSPSRVGSAATDLNNVEQTYSADFPGSPIYQQMLPGRAVEYRATYGGDVLYESDDYYDSDLVYDGSASLTVFTGVLDNMPQHPERSKRRVGMEALGTLTRLRGRRKQGRKVSTQLYASISTGVALGYLLDAAGWPADKRSLDAGSTILLYWWLDEEEPYQAALDLLAVEGPQAALWEDGSGVLHFEGRNYRGVADRSLTSQAQFFDSSDGANLTYEADVAYDSEFPYNGTSGIFHVEPFGYDQGFKNVINACTFETVQRALGALAVVWTYGTTLTLGPSETRTVKAKPSDPFTGALCTNGVDVTVSAGSIGSVSLSRTSGGNTDITLVAGAGGATVNLLRLRAQALTASSTTSVPSTVDASTSIGIYDQQDFTISARTDVDVNTAQDIANAIVTRYQTPQPAITITVLNVDANHLWQQLYRQVSDRITVYERHTGVSYDVHINQITHRVQKGARAHSTIFACEKAPLSALAAAYTWDAAVSTWGTATWGT